MKTIERGEERGERRGEERRKKVIDHYALFFSREKKI
jgi:hypothetical protein